MSREATTRPISSVSGVPRRVSRAYERGRWRFGLGAALATLPCALLGDCCSSRWCILYGSLFVAVVGLSWLGQGFEAAAAPSIQAAGLLIVGRSAFALAVVIATLLVIAQAPTARSHRSRYAVAALVFTALLWLMIHDGL